MIRAMEGLPPQEPQAWTPNFFIYKTRFNDTHFANLLSVS